MARVQDSRHAEYYEVYGQQGSPDFEHSGRVDLNCTWQNFGHSAHPHYKTVLNSYVIKAH